MEELELHAALLQHLVEWRRHHVAHARLHAKEDRALVGEEHAQHPAHGRARGERAFLDVAADVAEHQIVDAAQRTRVERDLVGAVLAEPAAQVEVIDAVPAVLEDVVGQHPGRGRACQVEADPHLTRLQIRVHVAAQK
jgi:hypothetical protein